MRTGKSKRARRRVHKSNKKAKKLRRSAPKPLVQKVVYNHPLMLPLEAMGRPFTHLFLTILKTLQLIWTTQLEWIPVFKYQWAEFKHRLRQLLVRYNRRYTVGFSDSRQFKRLLHLKKRQRFLQQALHSIYNQTQTYVEVYSSNSSTRIKSTWKAGRKWLIRSKQQLFSLLQTQISYFKLSLHRIHHHQIQTHQFFRQLWPINQLAKFTRQLERLLNKPIYIYIPIRYLLISLICFSSLGIASWGYVTILADLPDVTTLGTSQPDLTTKIYDRNGILLYKIYKNENRSLVPLEEIPSYLIQATIAIEDQNFYQHPGFSIRGISRAFKTNISQDNLQGGSTITQQLVKNTLLTPERTWERKIKELVLSFIAEFYYSKDEILAMYLNQVPYGGSAYGVEEASQMYFGKSVRELDLAEASFLAGLPAAPTKFSPYGTNPEFAKARQRQVIRRMVEDGYISAQDAKPVLNQELAINPPHSSLLAPHFVMYVRELLSEMYGSQVVELGGLEVVTSIDLAVQNQAQKIVTEEVERLHRLNVSNGAALITRPKTGEILAMVGSVNYFDSNQDGQVNVTTRPRQPGSSIKPLTYAMALERGFTPATIIPDTPVCYKIKGQPDYCPKNYDGGFHGRVTLRQALANSYNIPAVKTLAQFSVDDLIDKGSRMGISTWEDRNRFGLALTLGGGEVLMTDMAVAFGVFANQGTKVPLQPILEVRTADGEILAKRPCLDRQAHKLIDCPTEQVLDSRVAYQITNILSDNQARTPAFGANSVLHIPEHQVAVKTGTTNSLRDNWTIGYTSDFLVAVWVGNNDNRPMSYIASGITGASPIWNKLTLSLLNPDKPHQFSPPANLAKVSICTITGSLACNGCPSQEEYFIPGTEPSNHCSSEQIARILKPQE